jgi:hypothetical protein
VIINFNPKHGAEYYGIEQTFRFLYGEAPEVLAEYILLALSHGHPLNVVLSHAHPLNITLTQEVP